MFEIEKMEKSFDYSLVDDNTADFLRSCEYEMNGIAEDARVKFGRVLKRVQAKLANHDKGVFYKWFESGGMDKNDVYYYINLYKLHKNLKNTQKDNILTAPKSLQKEVMKKNVPEDLKQQVYNGDITTYKDYQLALDETKKSGKRSDCSTLYIIGHRGFDNYYKIGITGDIDARLNTLETASPLGLEIFYLKQTISANQVEKIIHEAYSHRRKNREWFFFSGKEVDSVIEYTSNLTSIISEGNR